ncbi:MAG: histidine kinase [Chitinophagales bacterium]
MLQTAEKNKLLWLQLVLGTLFLLQPIILPVRPDSINQFILSREILKNIFANVLILSFFYFNYFFLIPRFYLAKKHLRYFLVVFACLIGILFLSNVFASQLSSAPPHQSGNRPPAMHHNPMPPFEFNNGHPMQQSPLTRAQFFFTENDQIFFLFASIVLFSLLLQISHRYYKTENAKQEAEINYLLAQINPHFLFNALNSIYTLSIKENAQNASTALLKLSGLMRYVITETNRNSIPLEKEIACLNDFIDLQKLRLTSNVQLSYVVSGNTSHKQIAPMLLIPFVENAFKHGVNPDDNSEIQIKIDITEDALTMNIHNNKVVVNNDTIGKSGLGIANAKNRLNLLYPNKHNLHISETDHSFDVTLKLLF